MKTASHVLAEFAAALRLGDVPPAVVQRAKVCIADTVACCVYGAQLPWSRMVADHARRYGRGGPCSLFGSDARLQAPSAALANGTAAHAFEQDSLRFPGAGVHPGASLVPALAAACQDRGADGATALRAFIAGCEVLFRIGAASHHSSEPLGFHAPGLTGVYGAAVAAGVVYGLDAERLAHAMGIAGSMSAGLLAFTKARDGAMVKRLHIGRACEAGILAARLAQSGFTGPETILDGRYGHLDVYCRDGDSALFTRGLGSEWETMKICLKRYACHVTAQAPVQALRGLMQAHGVTAAQVAGIELQCSEKACSHHDIRTPADLMQAQYSLPFCLALALHRDPLDPSSFDDAALKDAGIAGMCSRVVLRAAGGLPSPWSARLTVALHDGRRLATEAFSFKGMPDDPLSADEEHERFLLLCRSLGRPRAEALHERLLRLEAEAGFPEAASPSA
jgi:2-methylcitrate dehydratase PrpD